MLILRYLIAEVFKTQLAVFLVLMSIIVSQRFISVLADASDGQIPGQLVFTLMAMKIPQIAALILPLGAFLGVLLALGRFYVDSEITVLKACGVSEWYLTRVLLLLSVLVAGATAALTLYVSPWAAEQEALVIEQSKADGGLAALRAGRFQTSSNQKSVIFVQNIENERNQRQLKNVFVAQLSGDETPNEARIVYAEQGQVIDNGDGSQQLQLEQGRRYQSFPNTAAMEIIEFLKYEILIQEQEVEHKRRRLSALDNQALLARDDAEAKAELQWRIAIPLAIPLLTLIAVPLAQVNPRQGRYGKLVPALLLYLLYFALLVVSRSAIESGKLPGHIGLWWIHLCALFLGSILIIKGRPLGSRIRATMIGWRRS